MCDAEASTRREMARMLLHQPMDSSIRSAVLAVKRCGTFPWRHLVQQLVSMSSVECECHQKRVKATSLFEALACVAGMIGKLLSNLRWTRAVSRAFWRSRVIQKGRQWVR